MSTVQGASTEASLPPRLPLTRARVLRAALELADAQGVESVSMRKLARGVGVEAMSLYHHVANKDDLLDGMTDLVFDEIVFPRDGVTWRAAMRERALSIRHVLARHPWAIGLMESRTKPGPAALRHHDAVIGCLRTAGFSVRLTAHAFSVLDSYIYGFALQERGLPFHTPEEISKLARVLLARLPAAEYPHLTELTVNHILRPGPGATTDAVRGDVGNEYEFGLELILDGLERALERGL